MNRSAWMKLGIALPIFMVWGCSQEAGTGEEGSASQAAQQTESTS